ncbi:MAG: hypothetical protein KDA25_01020 [Phycisphaerales bacterium]|nr:hypothetical protein [Phycisphaerales bacterium]
MSIDGKSPSPAGDPRPPTSALAWVALTLSLVGCCPLATVPGTLCGIVALHRIQRSGGRLGGRRAALAAILVGSAMTVVQFGLLSQFQSIMQRQTLADAAVMLDDVFTTAQSGGEPLDARLDRTAAIDADAIAAFGRETLDRYGAFRRLTVTAIGPSSGGVNAVPASVLVSFERSDLTATADVVVVFEPRSFTVRCLLRRLVLADRRLGDLTLPPTPAAASGGPDAPKPVP